MPDSDEERLVLRALAALIAFLLAAGIAVATNRLDDADDVDVGTVENESVFSGDGPPAGADVPSYVTTRRAALDDVEGAAVAAVSFDRYQEEGDARATVSGAKVRALLVAAPGGRAIAVRGSLNAWVKQERADAEAERDSLEQVVQTTDDPAFVAQYREDIARLTQLLARLDHVEDVVFGAVVEAEVEALRRVAGRAGVRLVDAAAERMADADTERLTGLRPEETARAGDPPTRPL